MAKGKYEKWLKEEGLLLLEGWARDGLTDEQIAHIMGIRRSTLNEWKRKYSDISDILKGKEKIPMRFRELEKIVKQDGWYLVDSSGSNHHYKHTTKRVRLQYQDIQVM